MSASNWTRCPRCVRGIDGAKAAQVAAAKAAYGILPIEEFDRLRADADSPVKYEDTVREDYEFYGFQDGKVVAVYKAHCQACGLSVEFRDEHDVPRADDKDGE